MTVQLSVRCTARIRETIKGAMIMVMMMLMTSSSTFVLRQLVLKLNPATRRKVYRPHTRKDGRRDDYYDYDDEQDDGCGGLSERE